MEAKSPVWTVLVGQTLVTGASTVAWWFTSGLHAALAALAGGAIAILPGIYMAARVFSVPADASPKRIVSAFYRGEAIKLGMTVVLFIGALQFFADSFGPLILTYILAILMYWLALRMDAGKQRDS